MYFLERATFVNVKGLSVGCFQMSEVHAPGTHVGVNDYLDAPLISEMNF